VRVPPYPVSLLRTPACPGFGVFGDRKSSCFDRSGSLRRVGGEWGVMGRSGDGALKWPCAVDRDAGAGSGSFERVQMGGLKVGEMRTSGGRPEDGSSPNGAWRVNGLELFERVQMRMVAGEGPAPGGSFGAAAAPFERVQMSLPVNSGDGDYPYSRRQVMQLQK
jgi:hypothetical protein